MVAPLGRAYRTGVEALGRRTPPFLQQIASYKRLGGADFLKPPQRMFVTWGFANMETSAGLLSRIETLITRDLLQKMTPSSIEEPE